MKSSSLLKRFLRGAAALLSAAILLPALSAGAVFSPVADRVNEAVKRSLREQAVHFTAEPNEGLILSLEDVKTRQEAGENLPHVWPVRFSESGYLSSLFGTRIDPVNGETTQFHGGIDLADKAGTKIHAAASGTVLEAEEHDGGYGLTILIDHGNGYQSRYSHCSGLLVEAGDQVTQGQVIATMGATGRVTGVHLDFRVYLDGELIDPLTVLDDAELG